MHSRHSVTDNSYRARQSLSLVNYPRCLSLPTLPLFTHAASLPTPFPPTLSTNSQYTHSRCHRKSCWSQMKSARLSDMTLSPCYPPSPETYFDKLDYADWFSCTSRSAWIQEVWAQIILIPEYHFLDSDYKNKNAAMA